MKLIFATHNAGKIKEMRKLLYDLNIEVMSAEEAGVTDDVVEDGVTFEENALKKARFVVLRTGQWAVADDSGLCIDAIGGKPGVYSARWAGEGVGDEAMIRHTLAAIKNVSEESRGAVFVSVLALVQPDGEHHIFEGKVRGRITVEPRGVQRTNLPYDTIFVPEGRDETFAEMSDSEKNSLSHRAFAFKQLRKFLKNKT